MGLWPERRASGTVRLDFADLDLREVQSASRRRLMHSVLAVSVCIVVLRSIGSEMYVDPVPGTRKRGFADSGSTGCHRRESRATPALVAPRGAGVVRDPLHRVRNAGSRSRSRAFGVVEAAAAILRPDPCVVQTGQQLDIHFVQGDYCAIRE